MNKAFSLFLMVALILGVSLGGAFASGVALGKTQGDVSSEARPAGNFSQGPGSQSGDFTRDRPQERGQGARTGGPEQRDGQGPRPGGGERQGFDGGSQGGPREGGGGRRGGRGVAGAIESVEGNTLTVTTPRGPVTVITHAETAVRKMVEGSSEDLKQGVQVRVIGSRDEDGTVKATAITLLPEGAQEFFGRGRPRQER